MSVACIDCSAAVGDAFSTTPSVASLARAPPAIVTHCRRMDALLATAISDRALSASCVECLRGHGVQSPDDWAEVERAGLCHLVESDLHRLLNTHQLSRCKLALQGRLRAADECRIQGSRDQL